MEEIIVIFFEFIFEVVLQILAELPWDLAIGKREAKDDQSSRKWQWAFVSLLAGGAVGMISLLILPNTAIKSSGLRVTYLILAPPFSAWIAFMLSRRFVRRGRDWVEPNLHALCAFCFALVLTIIRFTYAQSPAFQS